MSPQFNEQISPVPWHFIKLRFDCNSTLGNFISILPLTWSNFCFPSDYFYNYACKFTLDNLNHALSAWQVKKSTLQSKTLKLF